MKTAENLVVKHRTAKPSLQEKMLVQKYDPLSDSVVEQYVGVIVRATVDIARYARTIAEDREATEHYERLTRAAEHFAQIRFLNLATTHPDRAAEVRDAVESIDWPTVRPVISFPLSYDGSEPASEISFKPFATLTARNTGRELLPA